MASNSSSEYKVVADKIVSPDEDIIIQISGDVYKNSFTAENRYVTAGEVGEGGGGAGPTGPTGPTGPAGEIGPTGPAGSADLANFTFRDAGGAGVMAAGGNDITVETNDSKLVVASSNIEATTYSQVYLDPTPYYTTADWTSISYTIPFAGNSRISIVGASDTFFNTFSGPDFSVAKLTVVINDDQEFEVTSRGTSTPTKSITIDFAGEPYAPGYSITELSFNLYQNVSYRFTNLGSIELPATGRIYNLPNSSGDGNGYSTLELVPDDTRYYSGQYLIVDPTAPNHIHIRAGGAPDASSAELILGAEQANVRVTDYNHQVSVNTYDSVNIINHSWTFGSDGILSGPEGTVPAKASVPTIANDPGTTGQISWDTDYFYVCVAPNTWKRVPLTTW